MDSRQNQGFSGNGSQPEGGNYAFSGVQNDAFSSFVHTDNDSAFDSSWNPQTYPAQQQPISGFDQGNQNWQQSSYQSSNLMPLADYGATSKDFNLAYPRSPTSFDYGFIPNPNQTFSPSEYDNSLGYGSLSLNSSAPYDYPGQTSLEHNHHETISPSALQSYPDSFPSIQREDIRQSQSSQYGQALPVRRASTTGPGPTTPQEWITLSSATPDSINAKGMHIKPTAGLSNATKSTRVDGFTFVGNGNLASTTTKSVLAKFRRRRSVKELRSLLQLEKGSDPWNRDREPVLKKLKKTETQLAGPRPANASHSRSGSVAESASPTETSDSDSEDESGYYSESDVEVEPEEPSPLPATRPTDPNKAVEYDIIKAVWARKSVGLSSTIIRTALPEYWEIFKGIRDKWKAKAASLQTAIDKKDQANVKIYERRVQEQRRLLESCIHLTLKHGHPDLIEKLGENPAFIIIFYQFLADRFKESEYTGGFIGSILELMTRCTTIDQPLLEKTKMDKPLARLVKRGDDDGKRFAQRILDNAAEVSKQKIVGVKAVKPEPTNGATPKLQKQRSPSIESKDIKRDQPTIRKPSTVANKSSNSAIASKLARADARQPGAKADAKTPAKTAAADASATKIKTNTITAKPSGFFTGLKSASKRPGTSSKSEDGRSSTSAEAKPELKAEPPKPAFSFAATMASLTAQKEAPPPKTEETRKPESPEEKRKRLRKEQRRKLRVSFRADDELVQVREFVHDPEEELGHEDSQVRDVGDSRGEGQMLKMHKDLDIDEEEDYEPPDEISLPEWHDPIPIDFSVLGDSVQAQNHTSRGGKVEVKSEERVVQDQRERTTLMVIYTSPYDIPSSPREPSESHSGDHLMEETFGTPIEEWFTTRLAEIKQRAAAQAQSQQPPTPDISALLRIINSQKQAPPPQPVAPTPPPTGLEAIFAQFANQNQNQNQSQSQQQAPQMQMQMPQQQQPQFNLQAALAGMAQPSQVQPAYGAPPVAGVPNLQAILASFGNQPAPQVPQMQGFGYPNQYQNQNGNDRKRQYDNDIDDYGRKRSRGGEETKKKYFGPPRLPCKFWQEGKCRKGDECNYLHEQPPQ